MNHFVLCLFFGLPPFLIEWYFHKEVLWIQRRFILLVSLLSILTLLLVDPIAISARMWLLNPEKMLGIFVFNLPFEEYLWTLFVTNNIVNVTLILCYFTDHAMRFRQNFFKKTQK